MNSESGELWVVGLSDFARAKLIVYGMTAIMLLVMTFADPFHYVCNNPGMSCPGCGFKTAVCLALQLRWGEAVASNALIVPAVGVCILAIADMAWLLFRNRRQLRHVAARLMNLSIL